MVSMPASRPAHMPQSPGAAGIPPEQIIGIGIDTTGSTPMPVDDKGWPLALGEFQGNLWLRVTKIGGTTEDINVTDVNDLNSSADGSTLFFGLVASNASEQFTNIEFFDANPAGGDYFGFDDMTVGSLAQVCQNGCNNVPEPSSLPLVGLAFAALGFVGHRRLRNSRK